MSNPQFKNLESKVDSLIQLCDDMKRENQRLRAQARDWQVERQELVNKNQLARGRLEKVLQRLKSLQQE